MIMVKKKSKTEDKVIESIDDSSETVNSTKKIIKIITDFIIGFAVMWIVLVLHANATLTQFWGAISDIEVALMASLALSIVLLVLSILLIISCFLWIKKPLIAIGFLIAFPIVYIVSEAVQEGFEIFFTFI